MNANKLLCVLATLGASLLCAEASVANPYAHAPRATLQAFKSEQELSDLLKRWADEHRRRIEEQSRRRSETRMQAGNAQGQLSAAAPAAVSADASAASESITNVQHAGVDEGGIVKLHGEHLVVLRRGRLFTINVRDKNLRPVSTVDAYGEGINPQGAWYDEMLLSGNTIIVIGYSYQRGGTEIGLFDISKSGALKYKATYHLRSNDYYSSRNYASRLIGSKLIFYAPLYLNPFVADPYATFPAMRRWHKDAKPDEFKRIAPATRIYRTDEPLDPYQGIALHSVSVCDLAKPEMDCQSTAVMGAPGRVFYVSSGSVYVWTTAWRRGPRNEGASPSAVFRIPLDGAAPSALKTAGSPIDQFSFLESNDGHLNVLLRSNGRGDGMWAAEMKSGDMALLRVPLASFSDGRDAAPASAYRVLPRADGGMLQNRFVGPYLIYGTGASWGRAPRTLSGNAHAVRYADTTLTQTLSLAHGVDRIEAMGNNAVIAGSDGQDLHFTSVQLSTQALATDRYTRKDAAQGETRSHGFFYKSDNDSEGIVGLPVAGAGRAGSRQLRENSAAVLFLRNQSLRLSEIGALDATPAKNLNDGCRASCVDWYGNARPLFIGGRVYALMGYELVEGRIADGRISEVQRVNFVPGVAIAR